MTEDIWTSASHPDVLLDWLNNQPGNDRKLRLFCHACCCRIMPANPNAAYLHALRSIEDLADGSVSDDALRRIGEEIMIVHDDLDRIYAFAISLRIPWDAVSRRDSLREVVRAGVLFRGPDEPIKQCFLIREIVGNPFRPIDIDPNWRTTAVLDLAQTIYNEWMLERIPILVDALMDAGCNDQAILGHFSQPAPHVKGCWALDRLLGKS